LESTLSRPPPPDVSSGWWFDPYENRSKVFIFGFLLTGGKVLPQSAGGRHQGLLAATGNLSVA